MKSVKWLTMSYVLIVVGSYRLLFLLSFIQYPVRTHRGNAEAIEGSGGLAVMILHLFVGVLLLVNYSRVLSRVKSGGLQAADAVRWAKTYAFVLGILLAVQPPPLLLRILIFPLTGLDLALDWYSLPPIIAASLFALMEATPLAHHQRVWPRILGIFLGLYLIVFSGQYWWLMTFAVWVESDTVLFVLDIIPRLLAIVAVYLLLNTAVRESAGASSWDS